MVMGYQPTDAYTRPKDISLQFLNGVKLDFTLDNTHKWQTIDLEGIGNDVITNYANISVNSVYPYTETRTGFRELKVFGHVSGILVTWQIIIVLVILVIRAFDIFLIFKRFVLFLLDPPENIN